MLKGDFKTAEGWALANCPQGTVFYTDKKGKDVSATAIHYGKKIKTERLIVVKEFKDGPLAQYITKITIL